MSEEVLKCRHSKVQAAIDRWLTLVVIPGLQDAKARIAEEGRLTKIIHTLGIARFIVSLRRRRELDFEINVSPAGTCNPTPIIIEHRGGVFEEVADVFPSPTGVWKGGTIETIDREDVAQLAVDMHANRRMDDDDVD